MIERFEIIDLGDGRPDAERIVCCDGSGGEWFRDETDLELSHWQPNRTPAEYRAGTSTEICFRFLDHPRPGSWTAAVNNHVDVDGILSIYTLLHSADALAQRKTIVEAAEMGDFWGWGEPPAQRVFQALTFAMRRGGRPRDVYAQAFRRIPALIEGNDAELPEIDRSLIPLRRGVELVEQGHIARRELARRFAHYVVPNSVAGGDDERAAYAPEFNEAISDRAVLWPHVRARWDGERVCLVSTERPSGWFHDLWYPGYLWADTEGKWRPPGLTYHEGMSSYALEHAELLEAFAALQAQEPAHGHWALGGTTLSYGAELQERFPLVGRFLDPQGHAAISRLAPEQVAQVLEPVFRNVS
jgi:hypothetical protein